MRFCAGWPLGSQFVLLPRVPGAGVGNRMLTWLFGPRMAWPGRPRAAGLARGARRLSLVSFQPGEWHRFEQGLCILLACPVVKPSGTELMLLVLDKCWFVVRRRLWPQEVVGVMLWLGPPLNAAVTVDSHV